MQADVHHFYFHLPMPAAAIVERYKQLNQFELTRLRTSQTKENEEEEEEEEKAPLCNDLAASRQSVSEPLDFGLLDALVFVCYC